MLARSTNLLLFCPFQATVKRTKTLATQASELDEKFLLLLDTFFPQLITPTLRKNFLFFVLPCRISQFFPTVFFGNNSKPIPFFFAGFLPSKPEGFESIKEPFPFNSPFPLTPPRDWNLGLFCC